MSERSTMLSLSWPAAALGDAMEALARDAGLSPRAVEAPKASLEAGEAEDWSRWIVPAARWMGIEAEPVDVHHGTIEDLLRRAGPAIFLVSEQGTSRFLALAGARGSKAIVLGPDLRRHRLPLEALRAWVCGALEQPLEADADRLLREVGVANRGRKRARVAFMREQLRFAPVGGCWMLRLSPGASSWLWFRRSDVPRDLLRMVAAHVGYSLLWLASWWMVGRGVLEARLDPGWLIAWALVLLTLVPLRQLLTWSAGRASVGAGVLLKRRLLYGAMRLDPDSIRHLGAGQLLGRVNESEAVGSLALNGGMLAVVALIELALAVGVLFLGAGGWLHALLLIAWVILGLAAGAWPFIRARRRWTESRLDMTNDLVERLVGHRTRVAQERREAWHESEDRALESYIQLSRRMDRGVVLLKALMYRGWVVIGLLGLAPAFVSGQASPGGLAVGLGGVLLAARALRRLSAGIANLADVLIAWERVGLFFRAAARGVELGSPVAAAGTEGGGAGSPVVDTHDLTYRYPGRSRPVLQDCSLLVRPGERIILRAPSGAGMSTLASLLSGLRLPDSGLLLLHGLDRRTLGSERWRRTIVQVPQFHENHVLTETLAFNLLMGRRWPPTASDMREAESVCRDLGLGDLLGRMPSGILQMVGETGWQLSHGERSRLYIARALLQGGEAVILDESFAALDAETLARCVRCVQERARTLMVMAHQ